MSENVAWHRGAVGTDDRKKVTGGVGVTVWMTGLSGSGKSTIAFLTEKELLAAGRAAYVLDGDNLRHGLNLDLGFDLSDRAENVRRVGEVARLMADAGLVALVPIVSPIAAERRKVRDSHAETGLPFLEVFVDAPLQVCEARDPKGLYARARAGHIQDMTGIDSPYEPPVTPDLWLKSSVLPPRDLVNHLLEAIAGLPASRS